MNKFRGFAAVAISSSSSSSAPVTNAVAAAVFAALAADTVAFSVDAAAAIRNCLQACCGHRLRPILARVRGRLRVEKWAQLLVLLVLQPLLLRLVPDMANRPLAMEVELRKEIETEAEGVERSSRELCSC